MGEQCKKKMKLWPDSLFWAVAANAPCPPVSPQYNGTDKQPESADHADPSLASRFNGGRHTAISSANRSMGARDTGMTVNL